MINAFENSKIVLLILFQSIETLQVYLKL